MGPCSSDDDVERSPVRKSTWRRRRRRADDFFLIENVKRSCRRLMKTIPEEAISLFGLQGDEREKMTGGKALRRRVGRVGTRRTEAIRRQSLDHAEQAFVHGDVDERGVLGSRPRCQPVRYMLIDELRAAAAAVVLVVADIDELVFELEASVSIEDAYKRFWVYIELDRRVLLHVTYARAARVLVVDHFSVKPEMRRQSIGRVYCWKLDVLARACDITLHFVNVHHSPTMRWILNEFTSLRDARFAPGCFSQNACRMATDCRRLGISV